MKKLASVLFVAFFSIMSITTFAAIHDNAPHEKMSNKVDLYFFWSQDCSHCAAAHPFIDKLKAQYPWLKVHSLEASSNPKNARLFEKMARQHGKEPGYFPTFFICDKVIVGYTSAATTGQEIKNAIEQCHH